MNRKRYSAFTLIEMLVVMIILVVIGALSFATYQDMQSTIRLNEYTSVLEENIRRVQREAMLLKREPGEYWIYGLGIDLTKASEPKNLGKYTVFKWCSDSPDYGSSPKTTSSIPGYDGRTLYGSNNGVLPSTSKPGTGPCRGTEALHILSGYDVGIAPPKGELSVVLETESTWQPPEKPGDEIDPVDPPTDVLGAGTSQLGSAQSMGYILFESVTGSAFFYDASGRIVGYETSNIPPLVLEQPLFFEVRIRASSGGSGKRIVILPFSGKVSVGPLLLDKLEQSEGPGFDTKPDDETKPEEPKPEETKPDPKPEPVIDPISNPIMKNE